ncbi:GNAT family N-acetyltransferase [Paenibacillus oceani]|uniref:GNAT family N-acetyltransferase n=1 Tax=Paenibacillus oceani TaxID=2772510 RepID=A0A927C9C2_9BACL|nr:GNAT family N-acetyltransferase [Paenibacillus oceani]MBD2861866.1 GNAT family N-acetyltransferase [Paenibacillus oceani]
MTASNWSTAVQTVKGVLSATLACPQTDLDRESVSVHEAKSLEGRLRFPLREKSLTLVTMGKGVVISCCADRMDWARRELGGLVPGQIFTARTAALLEELVAPDRQFMAGPDQKYVCSADHFRAFMVPSGVSVSTYRGDQVSGLYGYTRFKHALSFRADSLRPDMMAAVAVCDGTVVGIAGASADSETMWQIGVDVLPEYQGKGIGKAIVGTLTLSILREGITPYYSTITSNLQSRQLAASLGYWPAWVEMYARDNS